MARLTLSEGRSANLRPMLAKDLMLLGDLLDLNARDTGYFKVYKRMVQALDAATIDASWEGGFGELPKDEILSSILMWDRATEDEALPPESGTSSETPSETGS